MSAAEPKRLTAIRLPRSSLEIFNFRLAWDEKNQLVDVVADDLQIRAAQRCRHYGTALRAEAMSTSPATKTLRQLSRAGNENDLVVQIFFGEEAGVARNPNTGVGAADRAVSDA